MSKTSGRPKRPSRLGRLFLRAPIALYHIGLGGMLGKRFLLLTHTGRTSGLPRQAVIEVVDHDEAAGVYYLASGWGERSDWLLNVKANPQVTIQVGREVRQGRASRTEPETAAKVFARYGKRNPAALKALARFMGYSMQGVEEDYRVLGQGVPMIALHTGTLPEPGASGG